MSDEPAPKETPLPADLDIEPKTAPPAAIAVPTDRGDCKTDYAPRPTRDPNPLCKVPGGTFTLGHTYPDDPAKTRKSTRRVTLSPFLIDQLEVTNAQYAFFLNTLGKRSFCKTATLIKNQCVRLGWDNGPVEYSYLHKVDGAIAVRKGYEKHPVFGVTWEGALLYCKWAGKTLPTSAQWEYAAKHDPETGRDYFYPWGNTFEPRRANCAEKVCKDGFKTSSPVGQFPSGASPNGVYGMAGNVIEWLGDCPRYWAGDGESVFADDYCAGQICRNPASSRCLEGEAISVGIAYSLPMDHFVLTRRHLYRKDATNMLRGFRCGSNQLSLPTASE